MQDIFLEIGQNRFNNLNNEVSQKYIFQFLNKNNFVYLYKHLYKYKFI